MPVVTSAPRPPWVSRSISGSSDSASPTLAPCSQTRGPPGPRRPATPRRSSEPQRVFLASVEPQRKQRPRERRRQPGREPIAAERKRQAHRPRIPASDRRRDRARRPAHRRARWTSSSPASTACRAASIAASSASAGTRMRSPTTIAPRPNGLPMLARSQELKSKRRLVTTAVGAIGRPDMRGQQ